MSAVMHAELAMQTPSDPEVFARRARLWFDLATSGPAVEFVQAVRESPSPLTKSLSRRREPFGEPGDPWCSIIAAPREPHRSASLYAWSDKRYDQFLHRLGEAPRRAELKFSRLDISGYPGDLPGCVVRVSTYEEAPFMGLMIHRQVGGHDAQADERADQFVDLVRRFVADSGESPMWGCVSAREDSTGRTKYETQERLFVYDTLGRGLLRGFDWFTLMGPELLPVVGGMEHLTSTEAFRTVAELNSAVGLQATQRVSQFGKDETERVHQALRAGLPTK